MTVGAPGGNCSPTSCAPAGPHAGTAPAPRHRRGPRSAGMRKRRSSRTPRKSDRSQVRGDFPLGTTRCPVGLNYPRDTPGIFENPIICVCSILDFLLSEEDLQGKTEEEIEMMKMMGFASFDTTKVSAGLRSLQGLCGVTCPVQSSLIHEILGCSSSGEEGGRCCQCLRHQRVPEEEVQVCPPSFGIDRGFCFVR